MKKILFTLIFVTFFISACRKLETPQDSSNPDWTTESHGDVSPNYNTVFPQDKVNQLEIIIGATNWTAIKADMKTLYGNDFGVGGGGPPGVFPTDEPNYVTCTVKFMGKTWNHVGFRLKGNSTLTEAWKSGNYKLPFRLNFDKFESQFPSIQNQKFYGFKDLSFSPGAKDQSLIREKVTADIFRMGGIPAPQTAFYRTSIDFGGGLKYCGIYCAVELPDDNMCKSQLGEESGNLYKPESKLLSFLQTEFEKKNNELLGDFSDVQTFVSALNNPLRKTDTAQWRTNLEAVFNMDHFTKWLAANNMIVNWDTYGAMAHNYYLYNHSSKKLMWLPWDNNEALSKSPGVTGTSSGGPGPAPGLSLTMNEVSSAWPLIHFVANDAAYFAKYKNHLRDFKNNVFTETTISSMIENAYVLITPYVIGPDGEKTGYTYLISSASYTAEKTNLLNHVKSRIALVNTFVP